MGGHQSVGSERSCTRPRISLRVSPVVVYSKFKCSKIVSRIDLLFHETNIYNVNRENGASSSTRVRSATFADFRAAAEAISVALIDRSMSVRCSAITARIAAVSMWKSASFHSKNGCEKCNNSSEYERSDGRKNVHGVFVSVKPSGDRRETGGKIVVYGTLICTAWAAFITIMGLKKYKTHSSDNN